MTSEVMLLNVQGAALAADSALTAIEYHADGTASVRYQTGADKIFLLDQSSSMNDGGAMDDARVAIKLALEQLTPHTFFNIISFGSVTNNLWCVSHPATSANVDQAIAYLRESANGNLGGTNVFFALDRLAWQTRHRVHPPNVVLVTDGHIFDTQEVAQLLAKACWLRVFVIGVGKNCLESVEYSVGMQVNQYLSMMWIYQMSR